MRIGLVSIASLNHTVAFARVKTQTDATALCRGGSRSPLQRKVSSVADATALCRGDSRLLLKLRR